MSPRKRIQLVAMKNAPPGVVDLVCPRTGLTPAPGLLGVAIGIGRTSRHRLGQCSKFKGRSQGLWVSAKTLHLPPAGRYYSL